MNDSRIKMCAPYIRSATPDGLAVERQRVQTSLFLDSRTSEGWCRTPTAYEDVGVSGFNRKPGPSLRRLFEDAMSGQVDIVLVAQPNRISRHLWILHEAYEQLASKGIVIYSAMHGRALHEIMPSEALKQAAAISRAMDIQSRALWSDGE